MQTNNKNEGVSPTNKNKANTLRSSTTSLDMAAAGCNNETPYEAKGAPSPLQKRNVSIQKVGGVDLRNIEERSAHSVLRDELDIDDETTIYTEVSDLETTIDTHRDNIEKDSSLIWNASEQIKNYGIELFSQERLSGDSESESDKRSGSFNERIDDLHEYVFDVSYDAGFQYAYQYPDNELISVLMDLWFAPDFEEDSELVTTLCESRWPGMHVHWVIFTQGVTDAFDCALGDLIGAEQ
ncbi:MAG: hypothetical protein EBZ48_09055 [Proteobacteria bacterium]|nr:hypothetical protein [Pseudomonadota bacterium]